jgi:hypothetical protein
MKGGVRKFNSFKFLTSKIICIFPLSLLRRGLRERSWKHFNRHELSNANVTIRKIKDLKNAQNSVIRWKILSFSLSLLMRGIKGEVEETLAPGTTPHMQVGLNTLSLKV